MSSRKINGYEQDSTYYDSSEVSEYSNEPTNRNYCFWSSETKVHYSEYLIMKVENVVTSVLKKNT